MRIVYFADLHLRNLKRHKQYEEILFQFVEKLKKYQVDVIIFTGDFFHSKINVSCESYNFASNFFRSLSSIAPLYIIPGNHDCYAPGHEVLTKKGWIDLKEYVNNKLDCDVATFDSNREIVEFQKPFQYIKKYYKGNLLSFVGKNVDMVVTPNHDILYYFNKTKKYNKIKAKDLPKFAKIPLNGKNDNFENNYFANLLGFTLADGTFVLKNKNTGACRIQFHFKKERKIKYLSNILDKLGYIYKIRRYKDGTVFICIYSILAKQIYEFFDGKKEIPNNIFEKSFNFLKSFLYGYLNGDGSHPREDGYWDFVSISKKNVKSLLTMCRLVGGKSTFNERAIYGNYENSKRQYMGSCNLNNEVNYGLIEERKEIDYDGFVYCVSVENSNLLIRHNDKIFISGNCVVKNQARLDAISPIVNALNIKDIHYLKYSQEVEIGEDIVLNHLSIVDKDNWKLPSNNKKINIALYHGAIRGSTTDAGWVVDRGDLDMEYLSNFDYGFLGDIHRSQILDEKGKFLYCGSLISQDFSEDNNKGFFLFEIASKDVFTKEFVPLDNPNPFVTIDLQDGKPPKKLDIKEGSFVRLVSSDNLSYDSINKAIDVIKIKYQPESVIFVNKSFNKKGSLSDESIIDDQQENYRDVVVQERLIRDFLKGFNITEDTIERVLELNQKYNTIVEQDEGEITRNVNWRLEKFEWNNLFNFGEDNKIDFTQLSGVVGLFGKSFSGKTATIDSLLYTIFNSITKNSRKNYNIVNQNKNIGSGKVRIRIGNDKYYIDRSSEKYTRTLHGKTTEEAKTVLNFRRSNKVLGIEENLNGIERDYTEKNIRRVFGTIEDFLLTAVSSQFGSLDYINEGSTRRKEILAKFLDLEIFGKKHNLAKDEALSIRVAIKKFGGVTELEKTTNDIKKELIDIKSLLSNQKEKCGVLKKEKEDLEKELQSLIKVIEEKPTEIIDIEEVKKQITKVENEKIDRGNNFYEYKDELKEKKNLLEKFEKFEKETFDIEEYKRKQKEIDRGRLHIDNLSRELITKEREISLYEKKTQLLDEVPCGEEYKHCKFISDAYQSLETIKDIRKSLGEINVAISHTKQQIDDLNPFNVNQYIEKYEKIKEKKQNLLIDIPNIEMKMGKEENELLKLEKIEKELIRQEQLYKKNKDVIENYERLLQDRDELICKLEEIEKNIEKCEEDILGFHRKLGSIEQQLEATKEKRTELMRMRKEYEAYDLFLKCYHSDGIPFEIIKRKLSYINSEIAKVLSSVVSFTVYFENQDDKFNLFIKHKDFDPRPLEMSSGAEKVLSSLAIRLVLTKISNLPKSNILVLDEPCLNLDSGLLESFSRLLDVIKQNYEIVILITHLDALKDTVDSEIMLETRDKYAKIVS